MKQLKMSIPLIQSHGVANMKFIELAGDAANGVILPSGRLTVADQIPDSNPQKKLLLQYKADFAAKYPDKQTNTFGGHAYDALTILVNAIEKVGPDKALIRDQIEKTTGFVGTGGIFNFSATDHNGLKKDAFAIITIEDGKWKLLEN